MVPEKLFCGRPTCNTVGAGNKYNKYTFQKQQWAIFAKNCYDHHHSSAIVHLRIPYSQSSNLRN